MHITILCFDLPRWFDIYNIQKDKAMSLKYFEKAARQWDSYIAQHYIGMICLEKEQDTTQNTEESV